MNILLYINQPMNLSYGYIYRSVITSDENPLFSIFWLTQIKMLLENREEPDEEEDDGEEEEEEEETRFVNWFKLCLFVCFNLFIFRGEWSTTIFTEERNDRIV